MVWPMLQLHGPISGRPAPRPTAPARLEGHRRVRTIPAVSFVLAAVVAGCGAIGDLVNPPRHVLVWLEVWNRTLDPVFLLDQEGRRLDVPAWGHAVAAQFLMNRVEIRTEQGFYFGTGHQRCR